MRIRYDTESDSLYIGLSGSDNVESEEVSPGVILDFDSLNHIVGIEIEQASKLVDLSKIETDILLAAG